ncbi:MAG TPA: DUF523 domain-containing protein [Synergistaceae bacterium]|nr:DUF523 domain-containing protein [Synergistaceae bacterium]
MYLLSACLVGINCRYNGSSTREQVLEELLRRGEALPLCPEVLGGLPTPRESCEIKILHGELRVLGLSGRDYTEAFRKGARKTLAICRICGIKEAILQSRSPSCGYGSVYDGTFSGRLVKGMGITAALLEREGLRIYSEKEWLEKRKEEGYA